MGDENDAFDLPTQSQSGNVDIGHISRDADAEEQRLRGEQSELLTNVLNQYYSRDTDFNQLSQNLQDLGYSQEQVGDISAGANAERSYRLGHTDGSGLSLNQLEFLQSYARSGLDLRRATIHTEDDGRTYIDDYRPTEEDGRTPAVPSKLYLPTPATFDPLTREQTSELQLDRTYLSHITLQEPSPDAERGLLQDNIDLQTRHAVSQLVSQYLSRTSEEGNDQRRLKLYDDIQQLPGLQNQRNIRAKLLQLFGDIAVEQQFRLDNNGRPRGLTDNEWSQLQNNPYYYGQPILTTDTQPPISYIVSGQNYIEIDDRMQALSVTGTSEQRDFSLQNQQDINMFSTEFLTDRNSADDTNVLSQNILSTINYDPQDPRDLRLRLKVEDLVNRLNQERVFRSQNNGRPSQLTQLQYDFLLNHALQRDEPRYSGEDITTHIQPDGSTAFGFHSWDRINAPELLLIPTDNVIAEMINSGVYVVPADEVLPEANTNPDDNIRPRPPIPAGGLPPLPETPSRPPIPAGGLPPLPETPVAPTADPQFTLPPDTPIIPDDQLGPRASGLGDPHNIPPLPAGGLAPTGFEPPIIPGQTQPINLRTGEDLPVDTPQSNILRYEQFFNDNQNLYYGFREIFRDILPVLSAGAGGYITYLYEASKQKGTIQTIINQETELMNQLQGRIDSTRDNINRILQRPVDITGRAGELGQARYEGILEDLDLGDFFYRKIEEIPEALQQARATIEETRAGLPPETGFSFRGTPQYQFNEPERFRLSQQVEQLNYIETLIEDQRGTIDTLQNEIQRSDIYTTAIQNNIERLQNRNYEILADLKQSAPKILMGVNVGYTLGLMLSGYLFPTYMNINEPYMTADNIEYDNKDRRSEKTKNLKQEKPIESIAFKREYDDKPSRIVKPFQENFRPVKHGKRPLKYKEIQELKSTLNKSELDNLKNKYLYFDENKLMMDKTNDKCLNVIQETQIPKRKIF